MNTFIKYTGLSMAAQATVSVIIGGISVLVSPALDSFLEKFIYIYYPAISVIAKYGKFKGDANIIRPILLGVPLGIFVYSLMFGLIVIFVEKSKRSL